jgi:hypothetical protein
MADFDLRSFFTAGAGAWIDSQREPIRNTQPVPGTQDGPAGQSQSTSYADVLQNPLVIGAGAIVVVLLLAILLKK